ncbi:putative bifunctional diguanylate cyclase/phosphodiesterase [Nocardioides nematodiphilus]|uniref:putative bifunctional diguanylate cyclase/phosphodiesterase n=1 Tax=Nocardioides nematodiphilus TaxID=2849669 RepID=UPI001CDA192E|nr:bifunctional diguanylate cyclase/phosphodiesterase [Nocardioides nematodiphilus]MCA1984437.1 bifunctional diguanylate cyclase/phosphodiesterase [Nocardioides nematodiphilus]
MAIAKRTRRSQAGTSTGSYRHAPAVATMGTLGRASGLFYLIGGIAALLPAGDNVVTGGRLAAVDTIGALCALLGIALLATGRHWPRSSYHLLVAGGAVLITATTMLSKGSVAAGDSLIVYVLPIIAGAAFFSWRGAVAHTAIAVASALTATTYIGIDPMGIVIFVTGLICIGGWVAWLGRLADRVEEDPLTGLGNRRALIRRLEEAVDQTDRGTAPLAVIMFDLDHFKTINDTRGHAAGDELLVACSQRWRPIVPHEKLLFRYGGDEFAVLLPGASLGEATELAEQLRAGLPNDATASIGVAAWQPGDSSSMLLGRADVALYEAKAGGRDQTAVYGDPGHSARELETALRAGEFVLHYQPIVALEDGTVRGHEALVRWQHPTRGLLGPSEFVALAERTGTIHALGAWTLDQACRTVAAGDKAIAVNVSIPELRNPSFVDFVHRRITTYGLQPRRLIIEVTEGVYDEDDQQVVVSLTRLRELGVRVALDDFGSGWSSLRWLTTFPVDIIKIDGSFVHAIDEPGTNLEVLNAVIKLGKALGLNVVGEQVETARQAQVLRELGCDRAQGYFFGRPSPTPEPIADLGAATHG